jgi:hypothetical protein
MKIYQFNLHLFRLVNRALRTIRNTFVPFFFLALLDLLVSFVCYLTIWFGMYTQSRLTVCLSSLRYQLAHIFFSSPLSSIHHMPMFVVIEPTYKTSTRAWKNGASNNLVWYWRCRRLYVIFFSLSLSRYVFHKYIQRQSRQKLNKRAIYMHTGVCMYCPIDQLLNKKIQGKWRKRKSIDNNILTYHVFIRN